MRKTLLYLLVVCMAVTMQANPRTQLEALRLAKAHFTSRTDATTRSELSLNLVATSVGLLGNSQTRSSAEEAFYIYNNDADAFVIVSGDDRMKPILGYSDCGAFVVEELPPSILCWLQMYVQESTLLTNEAPTTATCLSLSRAAANYPTQVEPLLGDIQWNQDAPYNNDCPLYQQQRSVTGCVATAMAMAMRYHKYPLKGIGSHSYTSSSLKLKSSFDFGAQTFDWENMLPQYVGNAYTTEQAAAVSTLMKACGVAVDMDYAPSGSGAAGNIVPQSLIDYFGYDKNAQQLMRDYFSYRDWMEIIKKELSEKRPIIYNGSSKEVGHEFIFDGYDVQNMIHVNWGWSGHNNGYFEVSSLNPDSPGIGGGTSSGGGFVYSQSMTVGLQKPSDETKYRIGLVMNSLFTDIEEVKKGTKFLVNVSQMYNWGTTFVGRFGLALLREDQTILLTEVRQDKPLLTYWGYNNIDLIVTIPADIADGNYRLCAVAKGERSEQWEVIPAQQGFLSYYNAYVAGEQVTLTDTREVPTLEGTFSIKHTLYLNKSGDFTITLKNEGNSEYYGEAGVYFVPKDNPNGAGNSILDILSLNPGEEKTLVVNQQLSNSPYFSVKAGDYLMCGVFSGGEYLYPFTDFEEVTIHPAPEGTVALSLAKKLQLEKTVLPADEQLVLTAFITNSAGVYDQDLLAVFFREGEMSSNKMFRQNVFLEEGVSEVSMSTYPGLSMGNYTLSLRWLKNGTYAELGQIRFSVSTPTDIETEEVGRPFLVYPMPVSDFLNVRSTKELKRIEIMNLSGCLVKQSNLQAQAGTVSEIPVSDLASGYYVLLLYTEDGQLHREKFLKK